MECPKCYHLINDEQKSCVACGTNLKREFGEIRFKCPSCNSKAKVDEKFCRHCGFTFVERYNDDKTLINNPEVKTQKFSFFQSFMENKAYTVAIVTVIFVAALGLTYYLVFGKITNFRNFNSANNIKYKMSDQSNSVSNGYKSLSVIEIQKLVESSKNGKYGIYIYNLSNDKEYSIGDTNVQKSTAGLIYLPIMITVLKDVIDGKYELGDDITVSSLTSKYGKFKISDLGQKFTIFDLLEYMIVYSDNTAGNLLIDTVGGFENINKTMGFYGCSNIKIKRKLMDFKAQGKGIENVASAHDMGKLFTMLSNKKILSDEKCDIAMNLMKRVTLEGFSKYLKDEIINHDVSIYQQIGNISNNYNDVGLISTKSGNKYIVSIMASKAEKEVATDIIGKVAKIVIDFKD